MVAPAIFLAIGMSSNVLVCSCLWRTADSLLVGSDAVFVGQVIDVKVAREDLEPFREVSVYRAKLRVLQSWKEPARQSGSLIGMIRRGFVRLWRWLWGLPLEEPYTLTVLTSDICGIGFQQGNTYLVFAAKGYSTATSDSDQLGTGMCTGTTGFQDNTFPGDISSTRYSLATLGPPPNDYRLPGDTLGYRPTREYTSEEKAAMLQIAAFIMFGSETRVDVPDAEGRFHVEYRDPGAEDWAEVGQIDESLLDADDWHEANAQFRKMRQLFCEHRPEHWVCTMIRRMRR